MSCQARSGQVTVRARLQKPAYACDHLEDWLGDARARLRHTRGTLGVRPRDAWRRLATLRDSRGPWHRENLRKINVELPGAGHSLEFVELGVGAPPPCGLFWKAQYMSSCSVSLEPVRRRQTSEMLEIQRNCTGGCSRAPNL